MFKFKARNVFLLTFEQRQSSLKLFQTTEVSPIAKFYFDVEWTIKATNEFK